jgi:hypothetical protein
MTVDFARLATVATELAAHPDPARMAALRRYLEAMSAEVASHHHVEDADVWPILVAVGATRPALEQLTDDHERLDPLLHRAGQLAAADGASSELADTLGDVADLLAQHVADEERHIFARIEQHVSVHDYRRIQQRFRSNLPVRQLPFVVPWVVSHATPEERPALLASAGLPLRLVLALVERRFRARQQRLFDPATSASRRTPKKSDGDRVARQAESWSSSASALVARTDRTDT